MRFIILTCVFLVYLVDFRAGDTPKRVRGPRK